MRTINDIYNEFFTVYSVGVNGIKEDMKQCSDYSTKILEEIFKPLVKQAGMEWGELVVNVLTKEVGVFKTGGSHLLRDYIIFCPFDKNWLPKSTHKNVTTSTSNAKILTALKTNYISYTGQVPEFNSDLVYNKVYLERGYYHSVCGWFDSKTSAEITCANICNDARKAGKVFSYGLARNGFIKGVGVLSRFNAKADAVKYLNSLKKNYGDILLDSYLKSSKTSGKYDVGVFYNEKDFVKAYVCG